MDFVTALLNAMIKGMQLYEQHINDPTTRLKARLEVKADIKKRILEVIRKEASVEEADSLAIKLLATLDDM
jgi:hypothetical protein